jgi:FkbM family methyltransferase
MSVKTTVKNLLLLLQLPVTKNLKYDILTKSIMRKALLSDSSAIDIGCHKGEILDDILKLSPNGKHFAFEPIPDLFGFLTEKYAGKPVSLYRIALFDQKGITQFNHVINAPAYSGLRKRQYDLPDVRICQLEVDTDLLDNIIPENQRIDFLKIDVEGAEFGVLKGAVKTIRKNKPTIIFEFGMGAADYYNSDPGEFFTFMTETCCLSVSTLKGYLKGKTALTQEEFTTHFLNKTEYYFIAYNPQ